ncbi:MAG: NAD-binding protein [Lachnospiraceae bacterium]|nr:NAD-binding protein [Lachnospiraceae bacterium]
MRIIIVGLGETGYSLVKMLDNTGHDITVIDKDRAKIDDVTDRYSVNGVCGSGASAKTLRKAGAETADHLIALTHIDEINLLTCMQGKAIGVKKCVARILMPDLVSEEAGLKKRYGIDLFVKPKADLADEVFLNIGKSSNNIVLVGGGITGGYLAKKLISSGRKLTILDDDITRCRELMEQFPTANVAYAAGDITEVLEEENVEKSDAVVSLTDNDETNLVISMYAWSVGVSSIITRVDRQAHVKLLHKVNIDITVSPTELAVNKIVTFINSGSL